MPRRALIALSAATVVVAAAMVPPQRSIASAQPAIEVAQRRDAGGGPAWGVARGTVDAPIESVVRVLEDYGSYASLFPHFTESRVISRRGARAMVYAEAVCVGVEFWFQLRMESRRAPNGATVIQAQMVRGNARRMEVRWTVRPSARGTTQVTLEVVTDADVPVPRSLLDVHNRAAARMGIESLRERLSEVGDALAPHR
jgi:ribosome-associated toxin RatA of RatAB toxin-antitoxin module